MSVVFIISPYDTSAMRDFDSDPTRRIGELNIDPHEYQQAIIAKWPKAKILFSKAGEVPYFPLHWVLPSSRIGFSGLEGRLHANLQIVTFGTGPKEAFLQFVLWHRSVIPASYPLFLSYSVSTSSLELKHDIGEQEIIEFTKILD